MSTILVQGLQSLKGEIKVQGSKNGVLPMMAASILHKGTTVIANVPRIQDVFCMMGILEYMGCQCRLLGHQLTIDASVLTAVNIPEAYVNSMRSSIMILGALLGRMGEAKTHYPGGCSIGKRPIDLHLFALRALGADIEEGEDLIAAFGPSLKGARIDLAYPSVGATENALLAAVLAEGATSIHGAAKEPEIQALCMFLNNMGARIEGMGSGVLRVFGVRQLHDSSFTVPGDRIVAGTYLEAVLAGSGQVALKGVDPSHLGAVLLQAEEMGAMVRRYGDAIEAYCPGRPRSAMIRTGPYPAFPTDLQSPVLAVMACADGLSRMEETVFEGRFGTGEELAKLKAEIKIEKGTALVQGRYPLDGGTVAARDLRGGAALAVGALAAQGWTKILDCHHISRGYEDICQDLAGLGAMVRKDDCCLEAVDA